MYDQTAYIICTSCKMLRLKSSFLVGNSSCRLCRLQNGEHVGSRGRPPKLHVCSDCGESKPTKAFTYQKPYCRECGKKRAEKYRAAAHKAAVVRKRRKHRAELQQERRTLAKLRAERGSDQPASPPPAAKSFFSTDEWRLRFVSTVMVPSCPCCKQPGTGPMDATGRKWCPTCGPSVVETGGCAVHGLLFYPEVAQATGHTHYQPRPTAPVPVIDPNRPPVVEDTSGIAE